MKTPISGKMFEICAVLKMIHKKLHRANGQYITQHNMTKKVETYVIDN
jgi:hypothetical protein